MLFNNIEYWLELFREFNAVTQERVYSIKIHKRRKYRVCHCIGNAWSSNGL